MRYFVQAVVVIVGFGIAIVALEAEQSSPTIGNCYEVSTTSAPTICR